MDESAPVGGDDELRAVTDMELAEQPAAYVRVVAGLRCSSGRSAATAALGRTTGYHEAWAASPEDLPGLASLAVELLFIGCAAFSLTRDGSHHPQPARLRIHDRTAPFGLRQWLR